MFESIQLGTWVLIAVAHVLACVLVYWDASNHCDYGWLWFICCVFCPPLVVVYIVLRLVAGRGAGGKEEFKRKLERAQHGSRPITEVERLHYLSMVADGAGTMYEGADSRHGYRHFTDSRAESLIEAGQHERAFDYLVELYTAAKADSDGIREDTYLYYLCQLPGGKERLELWEAANIEHTQGGTAPPF